jgi:hypothetical protein
MATLERAVRALSPRHRRWHRHLEGLRIDPDLLERPVAQPSSRDFVICGAPRSGTTLLAAMLWQPPEVITVSEPWDGLRLAPADLFSSIRAEIAGSGALRRGRLDVEHLERTGEVVWGRDGEIEVRPAVSSSYLLGVKWPAFWRYLPILPETKFLVCLRKPRDVITSCRDHGGDLRRGLDYQCAFNRTMNAELRAATTDHALRRVLLYEYINDRLMPYLDRPNVFVVRYERWFGERDRMVSEIADFLGMRLGPGLPAIREPRGAVDATPHEIALIEEHCDVAGALGYPNH